jgi:hypothetical protein
LQQHNNFLLVKEASEINSVVTFAAVIQSNIKN